MLLYNEVAKQTINLLQVHKDDWEMRYKDYLAGITKGAKNCLQLITPVEKPLFIYTTVTNEKSTNPKMHLRFMGQDVGRLSQKNKTVFLNISIKDYINNVNSFVDYNINSGNYDWETSPEAKNFRNFFYNYSGVKNNTKNEHTVESAFLTDLEKAQSSDKALKPVEINGKRFQMPTPFRASKLHNVSVKDDLGQDDKFSYAGRSGGGIDILACRIKDNHSFLTVIELKDKKDSNEPPEKVMYQAIAYATFIHELVRSEKANGIDWYNLFLNNEKRKIPDELVIKCVVAMPGLNVVALDKELGKNNLNVLMPFNNSKDKLELLFINLDDKTYGVKDYSEKL